MKSHNYKHVLLIFVALSTFIILFAGCTNTPSDNSITTRTLSYNRLSPEDTVKGFIESIKTSDFDKTSSYTNDEDSRFEYGTEEEERVFKPIFSKIEYEIVSSSIGNDSATVKTEITAPDLDKIADQAVDDLLNEIEELALEENTEDIQFSKMLIESFISHLSVPNLPLKTTKVNINLIKYENTGKWVIELDEDLLNAITGNLGLADGLIERIGKEKTNTKNESYIENESIKIDIDYTSNETTIIDEEFKKELEDLLENLDDIDNW